jgi:hypothetical protein
VTAARPTNKLPAESPKIIADQKLPQELYENLHKEESSLVHASMHMESMEKSALGISVEIKFL